MEKNLVGLRCRQRACILGIRADQKRKRQLEEMGLLPGTPLLLLLRNCGGTVMIKVRDSILMLGQDTARSVRVWSSEQEG
ncbi:FeoA domain-containing protein [Desulfurispora thermophila]|uniref:FeoA domain-containing protein n=1 Tax=Desulfurispora thermophila TaxID=265470 RepID=UPI00035D9E78|nr:FeoA domain-containing protein [Desulfurispora thermophila]